MDKAEQYVEAGMALIQLGRRLQRYYPSPTKEGTQFDEGPRLLELLPEEKGIYIDIGASDPVDCSNTWPFYKRGWRGLLIDPLPDCWGAILAERREDRLCPFAASNQSGLASLHVCRSTSSLRQDWPVEPIEVIPVRVEPVREILKLYQDHDWRECNLLSIDVEGHEKEVLEGIDWTDFRPRVVIIEYADYRKEGGAVDMSLEWRKFLYRQSYKLHYQNQLNQIWTFGK